jgi:hypothetical protein
LKTTFAPGCADAKLSPISPKASVREAAAKTLGVAVSAGVALDAGAEFDVEFGVEFGAQPPMTSRATDNKSERKNCGIKILSSFTADELSGSCTYSVLPGFSRGRKITVAVFVTAVNDRGMI